MPGAIAYYDWLIPENQDVGVIPPSVGVVDSSTGGAVVGDLSNLYDERLALTYGRTGIDRSLSEVFQIDIITNSTTLGETQATYGAIAAIGVKVTNNASAIVDAKVTVTVDANSGSYGGGTVFSGAAYVAAADAEGRATYPNRSAVFFPFASSLTDQVKQRGGMGGSQRNKIRVKIEPKAGTGGSTGVPTYNVELSRIMVSRCFFANIMNGSLNYRSDDKSVIQRAYSGAPYINRKPIIRSVSGQFAALSKAQVFGVDGTTDYPASMQAVNGFAGVSTPVIFSPRLAPASDEIASGVYHEAWSNEHLYGLMDASLSASLISVTQDVYREYWACNFALTEIPAP